MRIPLIRVFLFAIAVAVISFVRSIILLNLQVLQMFSKQASNHTIQKSINHETPKAKTLLGDSKNIIFGRSAASLIPLNKKLIHKFKSILFSFA